MKAPRIDRTCAVVPVRDGSLPAGGAETVAEADGFVLLIGSGVEQAVDRLGGVAREVVLCEAGDFAPATWAAQLTGVLAEAPLLLLPASPDGRDLAPRLAASLGRDLITSALRVGPERIDAAAFGGRAVERHSVVPGAALVVTLQPGARALVDDAAPTRTARLQRLDWPLTPASDGGPADAVVAEVLPPDVSTMDLSEAPRLLGGGAGLESAERFAQLSRVARSLGAAMGATRVITDRGWIEHDRQIGTTGVVVDPRVYLAFGISGAVQHTAGLGNPDHIISVNLDEHCPMMELADLAIVSDANRTLAELEELIQGGGR